MFAVSTMATSAICYSVWIAIGPSGFCTGCGPVDRLSMLAIVATSVLSVFSLWETNLKLIRTLVMVILFAVPIVQSVLLGLYAKLCFGCISAGCTAVAALILKCQEEAREPHSASEFRAVFLPLVCISTIVYGAHFVPRPDDPEKDVQLVQGMTFSTAGLPRVFQGERIVLLTLEGCSWCEKAKERLSARGVEFKEVSLQDPTLNGIRLQRSFAPQLLVLNSNIITQHIRGYDERAIDQLGENK